MIYGNCLCLAELDPFLYYIKAPLKIKEDIGVKAYAPTLHDAPTLPDAPSGGSSTTLGVHK